MKNKKIIKSVIMWAGLDCPQHIFDYDEKYNTDKSTYYRQPYAIFWTRKEAREHFPSGEVVKVKITPIK